MRSDDVTVDAVVVAKLNLDASTEWRKHFREDDLFVPDRFIAVLPYGRFALHTHRHIEIFLSEDSR